MTQAQAPTGVIRTANASGLGAVERELASMHKAMLRAGGDAARAVRLSVVTLVVACIDDAEADRAAGVVSAIAAQHPARALLVVAHRDGPSGIEADMRLECSLAGGPDNQVCAEIVRLRVGGAPAAHLSSVVTPLLLPDVPVHLWVAGAPPLEQALAGDTLALVERLVLDSDAYASGAAEVLRALAGAAAGQATRPPFADLAWVRMEPWREAVARAFDAPARRPLLAAVESASIRATGRASGLLAGGWLVSRLGISPGRVSLEVPEGGRPGLESLRVRCAPPPATLEVERSADGLRSTVTVEGAEPASRDVPLDPPSLAELVGAALQEGGEDPVYAQALQAAAGMAA